MTSLAAGMMAVLAMCRIDQLAWKLIRLVGILVLALLVLAITMQVLPAVSDGHPDVVWPVLVSALAALMAGGVVGLAPVAERCGAWIRGLAVAGGVAGLAASWQWSVLEHVWPTTDIPRYVVPALFNQVISAVLTGSVTLATAMGHAYLTQTRMTIRPLRRVATIFAVAMGIRIVWSLFVAGSLCWLAVVHDDMPMLVVRQQALMLIIRGVVGLAIPAVFAYMILETVRLRATQSATGILYFTMVLIYIGELTGLYLLQETAIAF